MQSFHLNQTLTEWKKEISTITERTEAFHMNTYLRIWATVIKLRPDPSKKKDYDFVPVYHTLILYRRITNIHSGGQGIF